MGFSELRSNPTNFAALEPPSKALSIRLSVEVVRRLHQLRNQADGEMVGVLLGHSVVVPKPVTFVEDFLVLNDVKHQAASSQKSFIYRLRDLAWLAGTNQRTVGCFRWQSGGPLSLTEQELESANDYFSASEHVILLIRSKDLRGAEAAFFWREKGRIPSRDSGLGFPFEISALSPAHSTSVPDPSGPAPLSQAPNATPWPRLIPTVAIAMIASIVGVVAFNAGHPGNQGVVDEASAQYTPPLGLEVSSQLRQVIVQWNKNSKAIASAKQGKLKISDGDTTKVLEIDAANLKDGLVAYQRDSRNVGIRLEVQDPDGKVTSESVQFVAPR